MSVCVACHLCRSKAVNNTPNVLGNKNKKTRQKISPEKRQAILRDLADGQMTQKEISEKYNVCLKSVNRIHLAITDLILEHLKKNQGSDPQTIANATGLTLETVEKVLKTLKKKLLKAKDQNVPQRLVGAS